MNFLFVLRKKESVEVIDYLDDISNIDQRRINIEQRRMNIENNENILEQAKKTQEDNIQVFDII